MNQMYNFLTYYNCIGVFRCSKLIPGDFYIFTFFILNIRHVFNGFELFQTRTHSNSEYNNNNSFI